MSSFQDFGLRPEILKAISALGFETPTDIQAETIPFLLDSKKDLIAMAQTGTGKTAGFGLPILNQIDPQTQGVQSLILSPTRELCMQISSDLKAYAKGIPGFRVLPVYGGTSIQPQISDLRRGVNVVVGTPGRTLDLINRRILKVNAIKWLVLDEADEMLSMG
ncbi:MAG: DEAD/DEAH box helicase, partial [Bacteroidales bacterium]|nr:DEAD/DEAH box helicase [Bacteroidales bacterium]